jgi:hypothetical protein
MIARFLLKHGVTSMAHKARGRPSWKKQRYFGPPEIPVALVPIPLSNPYSLLHDMSLIDDQTLDDALRAPGVPPDAPGARSPGEPVDV